MQLNIVHWNERDHTPVLEHWARVWAAKDAEVVHATIGNPESQAVWEAYALLLTFRAWTHKLAVAPGNIFLCGDALGVLHDAIKMRARDKRVNSVIAEIALTIAPHGFELNALHVWSEWNGVCDEFNRGRGCDHSSLRNSKLVKIDAGKFSFLRRHAAGASESEASRE